MPGVVYDTGALIAADRRDLRIFDVHDVMLGRRLQPVVPVVVLAQAWRGGSHPMMSRLLKGCLVLPDNESVAKAAGALCAVSRTEDIVDSIVVVTAAFRQSAVVTSDPQDLRHLADVMGIKLDIFQI